MFVQSRLWLLIYLLCLLSNSANAFVLNGDGHFSLLGAYRSNPAQEDTGDPLQGIRHNMRLGLEAVGDEKLSAHFEFRLTDNLRAAYLGDTPTPDCPSDPTKCPERKNPLDPQNESFDPRITKAYVRAAFEYCILEAGRRGRDWGMGALLDSGTEMFETDASVFDGFDCTMNLDKLQTLGFSVGFDKIQETDFAAASAVGVGATTKSDDINQLFFSLFVDDRAISEGSYFKKNIGVYVAYIFGEDFDTSIKLADLYINLLFGKFNWQNEIIFRMGDSKSPALIGSGAYAPAVVSGTASSIAGLEKNNLDSTAIVGKLEYSFGQSGAYEGPKEFAKGDFSQHVFSFDYAFVPGDQDGYDPSTGRDTDAKSMSLHQNYKPARILFNAPSSLDNVLNTDGIYDASRVSNAMLFGLGYRYESLSYGDFGVKVLQASLLESMSSDQRTAGRTGIGYEADDLGTEVDFTYNFKIGAKANIGANMAYLVAGDAWKKSAADDVKNSFLFETYVGFKF